MEVLNNQIKPKILGIGKSELIYQGIYFRYDNKKLLELKISDNFLSTEPYATVIKCIIPTYFNSRCDSWTHNNTGETSESIERLIDDLIKTLRKKPNQYELNSLILSNINKYGIMKNYEDTVVPFHFKPELYPIFACKVLDFVESPEILNGIQYTFSNSFFNKLLDYKKYSSDILLDTIDFFDVSNAVEKVKLRNIEPYISKIEWTFKKMNKQQITFEQVLKNIQLFSSDDITKYAITQFTENQLQTLLLTKEMI